MLNNFKSIQIWAEKNTTTLNSPLIIKTNFLSSTGSFDFKRSTETSGINIKLNYVVRNEYYLFKKVEAARKVNSNWLYQSLTHLPCNGVVSHIQVA